MSLPRSLLRGRTLCRFVLRLIIIVGRGFRSLLLGLGRGLCVLGLGLRARLLLVPSSVACPPAGNGCWSRPGPVLRHRARVTASWFGGTAVRQ